MQYIFSGQIQNEINSQRFFEYSLRVFFLRFADRASQYNLGN